MHDTVTQLLATIGICWVCALVAYWLTFPRKRRSNP